MGLIPHLTGGALAITTGLVQIWLGLTNRVSTLHRALGKVYATGVLQFVRAASRWLITSTHFWRGPAGPSRYCSPSR
jgi:hypothetical protein